MKAHCLFLVALTLAVFQFASVSTDNATAAELPKDACTLLTSAAIQAELAPDGNVGPGTSHSYPRNSVCNYAWGPKNNITTVTVSVGDMSGASPDGIEHSLLSQAKASDPNASQIPGLGDLAVFYLASPSKASADAYFKTKDFVVSVSVMSHGQDALQYKDKVISLLKHAASKL